MYIFEAIVSVANVSTQHLLFRRDTTPWFDVSALIQGATQVNNTSEGAVTIKCLCNEYPDILKYELKVLHVQLVMTNRQLITFIGDVGSLEESGKVPKVQMAKGELKQVSRLHI